MDIKDFYFIYVITGDNYIKSILKIFDHVSPESNVVVITNTPKLLRQQKVKFNLIIEDLESLRSDWSRKNEFVLDIEDEQAYVDKLSELYQSGYKYPMSIFRYGIKWAVKNNVTKFLIADSGVNINYYFDSQKGLNKLNQYFVDKKKNLFFGSNVCIENVDLGEGWIFGDYYDTFKKHVPNLSKTSYDEILYMNNEANIPNIRCMGFDGHTFGFFFEDVKLVEKFFDLWEDVMIRYFELGISSNSFCVSFEWVMVGLSSIFYKYYNTFICGHNDIIAHLIRPENDFFAINIKLPHDKEWVVTKTREDFIKINKDKLINHYGGEQRVKDIVYDYEKIINSI